MTTRHSIPLQDGLIINKETQDDQWLIEGIIHKDFKGFFDKLNTKNELMLVEATITYKDNPPASFVATVRENKFIEDDVHLLLDAKRLIRKENYSEKLLKSLIEKGFSGDELLREFKRLKKERGTAFQLMVGQEIKHYKSESDE